MSGSAAVAALVLASASPRRLELLRQIGLEPAIIDPPHIDESHDARELPQHYALRMAREKLSEVAARHQGAWIIAADTVVACGRRILPKAEDEASARRCLELLSGRRHRVLGGVAIQSPAGRRVDRLSVSQVSFKRLSEMEIRSYLAGQEWHGKAGGYAIQGRAAAFVDWISGSYSNIVGLPLHDVAAMLTGLGWDWR